MFSLGGNQRIYYCAHPVNLRKSFDGLAGAVQEYIGRDPASGHLFVFFSRNKKLVKMLFYQDGGMCIFAKRLNRVGIAGTLCDIVGDQAAAVLQTVFE